MKSQRMHAAVSLIAVAVISSVAGAQNAPMFAPCADPAIPQLFRPNEGFHWYVEPSDPPYWWADRRPTAVIQLFNGNWVTNDRGLEFRWWGGEPYYPSDCADAARDDNTAFNVESGLWSGNDNWRPDQIDWLLAQLQNRYDRGYRRIVLHLPAGAVTCQPFAQAQWWPMAQWRRDWFETTSILPPLPYPQVPLQGIMGWIQQHATLALADGQKLEIGVYVGWPIGNACTMCAEYWPDIVGFCKVEGHDCPSSPVNPLYKLWKPCAPGYSTHEPSTLVQDDMEVVWQNVDPWRDIGFGRFWMDASSGAASNFKTEFREFVNNWNFTLQTDPPVFGGEAFPYEDTHSPPNDPLPDNERYVVAWPEFNYSPWVIDLNWAERRFNNGIACAGQTNPTIPHNAHTWKLLDLPFVLPVKEGAIFFSEWPKCENGSLHSDWDKIGVPPLYPVYDPFERLRNLYEWYICKGFCFWQGDLDGWSGAAERIFGFGQIKPAGDFNGDGVADEFDSRDFDAQYTIWAGQAFSNKVLTYYHGDLNSDGAVDSVDLTIAHDGYPQLNIPYLIGNPDWPFDGDRWWLGKPVTHSMTWNPNEKWLPCCCGDGGTSGPSGSGGPP